MLFSSFWSSKLQVCLCTRDSVTSLRYTSLQQIGSELPLWFSLIQSVLWQRCLGLPRNSEHAHWGILQICLGFSGDSLAFGELPLPDLRQATLGKISSIVRQIGVSLWNSNDNTHKFRLPLEQSQVPPGSRRHTKWPLPADNDLGPDKKQVSNELKGPRVFLGYPRTQNAYLKRIPGHKPCV